MKPTKIQTGFILPLAVLLATVAWFFVFHQPKMKKIRACERELAELREKIGKDVPESLIQSVQKQSDSILVVLESKKKRIFPFSELIRLGDTVQPVVKKYGLSLVALKPDYKSLPALEADTSEICELPISIQVEGKYDAFTRFMDDLAVLPFVVRVDDYFIDRLDKETRQINFEIKGVIFLRKTAAKPGGSAGSYSPAAKKP
jgi:Tfp pilus assembly protein PilO